MEKAQENQSETPKPLVWDCGSSLYDSFELNSLKRQIDSAISSRTMSMPHLPDRRPPSVVPKKHSKISRSLNKLFRSVFKPKPNSGSIFRVQEDEFFVIFDKSKALASISEVDFRGLSPEIGSLVGKSNSDRFTVTSNSMGILCP